MGGAVRELLPNRSRDVGRRGETRAEWFEPLQPFENDVGSALLIGPLERTLGVPGAEPEGDIDVSRRRDAVVQGAEGLGDDRQADPFDDIVGGNAVGEIVTPVERLASKAL